MKLDAGNQVASTMATKALPAKGGQQSPSPQPNGDGGGASTINWGDRSNSLFQTLLKDPSVQAINEVTENADGTYSLNALSKGNAYSTAAQIAVKMMVNQQNSSADQPIPDGSIVYSTKDEERFKALTGYNIVQAGGGDILIDDNGKGPGQNNDAIDTLWSAFSIARGVQDIDDGHLGGVPDSDVTVTDLNRAVSDMLKPDFYNKTIVDKLLKRIQDTLGDDGQGSKLP